MRHRVQKSQMNRDKDHRKALLRNMCTSFIEHGKMETTLAKAKYVKPFIEKTVTKAKKGNLHNRRQIIAALQTVGTAHRLCDEISPKLGVRTSGHLRIVRTDNRRGDNAEMARVSFVDDLAEAPVAKAATPIAVAAKETNS